MILTKRYSYAILFPEAKRKEVFQMMLAFKVSFFSIEKGSNCFKFASTLGMAQNIIADLKKNNKGKNFKIIPIKLK